MIANAVTSLRLLALIPLWIALQQDTVPARWAALGLLLFAGATDVLDGWLARRLGQTSRLGAMLDLMADRLLTLVAVIGLIVRGDLHPVAVTAAMILAVRCAVVATLGEAWPGRLDIRVTPLERVKIALQFLGLGLAMAPPVLPTPEPLAALGWGGLALAASAALTCLTVGSYFARALQTDAAERRQAG
jgi:phosphatidylglycerophosphate synthase